MTRPRLALLILFAAGALAWLVARLVVTDAEAIESTVTRMAETASAQDWKTFESLLADDFESAWGDREKLPRAVAELMKRFDVRKAEVRCGEITVRGDRGAASITVLPGAPARGFPVPARVDLVRTDDGWRVVAITTDVETPGGIRLR